MNGDRATLARQELARRELARRELARRQTLIEEPTPTKAKFPPIFSPTALMSEQETITPTDIVAGTIPIKAINIIAERYKRPLIESAERPEGILSKISDRPLVREKISEMIPTKAIGDIGMKAGLKTAEQVTPRKIARTALEIALDPRTYIPVGETTPVTAVKGKTLRIMGKDYTLNQAKILAQDLKDLRTGYGLIKEDMLLKVGSKAIDETKMIKSISGLPQAVIDKFDDPIYGIERTAKGAFKSNIQNVDKMREAIGDLLSSRDWIEATKTSKGTLRHIFNELGNLMKQTSPEVTSSLDAYANFMKSIYRPAEKVLFRSGQIVEKPLRGAVKAGAERTTQQALEGLAKSVATSKQALKNMIKFTGREQAKRTLRKVAPYLLFGGGGLYGLSRVGRH